MSCAPNRFAGEGAGGGQTLRLPDAAPHLSPPPLIRGREKESRGNARELLAKKAGNSPGPSPKQARQSGGRAAGPKGRFLPNHPDLPVGGLDFGSRFVKLVCSQAPNGFVRRKLDSLTFYRDYLSRGNGRLLIDWKRLGLAPPVALVATGYGKNLLKEHFPTITEIRAHFLGARFQTGLDHFILLEMGGQDTKVLYVKAGRVFDFLTNDRCAAGTGRYLENMARFLKMPLTAFAAAVQSPIDISQTCAIFGESELVGHLLEGVDQTRIAAGVNASVARRALAMVQRYPCPTLLFAGGVARNRAVVQLLQDQGNFLVIVAPHPQFTGALGCCLEAGRELLWNQP